MIQDIGNHFQERCLHSTHLTEVEKKELIWLDSCENSLLAYKDDYGWPIEFTKTCFFEEKEIRIAGQPVRSLLKITKEKKNYLHIEGVGVESKFTISIATYDKSEEKVMQELSFYGDEIEIKDNHIQVEHLGCCGVDSKFQQIDLITGLIKE